MLKLKLQYFGHLMWRADSLEKTLMLGKIKVRRRRDDWGWGGWMASLTQWTWVWVSSRSWWWTGRPGMLQSMRSQKIGHNWTTELNWTELLHYRWILYQLSYLGSLWCLWPGSYRVMLALWNKFESVQSCSIWWKCLKRTSTNSSLNVGYNSPGKPREIVASPW